MRMAVAAPPIPRPSYELRPRAHAKAQPESGMQHATPNTSVTTPTAGPLLPSGDLRRRETHHQHRDGPGNREADPRAATHAAPAAGQLATRRVPGPATANSAA